MCGQAIRGCEGCPACGMHMACAGAWRRCRDEPGGCQAWGMGTGHAGVWCGVLAMSLEAIHTWLRALAHHTVKSALEHMDGGHGWGLWHIVGRVGHGLAMGGKFHFKDDIVGWVKAGACIVTCVPLPPLCSSASGPSTTGICTSSSQFQRLHSCPWPLCHPFWPPRQAWPSWQENDMVLQCQIARVCIYIYVPSSLAVFIVSLCKPLNT